MKEPFGILPSGEQVSLYTIQCGAMRAQISDFGATLVRLFVPDRAGKLADVVLGFGDVNSYRTSTTYFGATVGRNANRIGGAGFQLGEQQIQLDANDGSNNLHSGAGCFAFRMWTVEAWERDFITFSINSPNGDQGFPGNAQISVTYALESGGVLCLTYEGVCDQDTVFNFTNHSYFNLAGHDKPEFAMGQLLTMPARYYTAADGQSIPTGQMRSVAGTPMDFRTPKPVGRDIGADYEALCLQGGYDHNFEVFTEPCAILSDPVSGRSMAVVTDCPGIQFYSGNYLDGEQGKDGVTYCKRGGICLETQFYPDAVHHRQWAQPIVQAGPRYRSQTRYIFK